MALKIFFSAISKFFYVQGMREDPLKWFVLTRIVFDQIQYGRQNCYSNISKLNYEPAITNLAQIKTF